MFTNHFNLNWGYCFLGFGTGYCHYGHITDFRASLWITRSGQALVCNIKLGQATRLHQPLSRKSSRTGIVTSSRPVYRKTNNNQPAAA